MRRRSAVLPRRLGVTEDRVTRVLLDASGRRRRQADGSSRVRCRVRRLAAATRARPYLLCDAHVRVCRLLYHVVRHTCLSGIRSACPAGTYGATTGLSAATCSGKCSAGFYGSVAGQTEPTCEGECEAGFMCPAGSVSPTAVPCGSSAVYCPANSGEPTPVSAGYYSVGPTASTVRGMVHARQHA